MTRRDAPLGGDLLAVSAGTDLDPVTGALLSITELQAKLRGLSTATPSLRTAPAGSGPLASTAPPEPLASAPTASGVAQLLTTLEQQSSRFPRNTGLDAVTTDDRSSPTWSGWPEWMRGHKVIAVAGATPGCGCSTVALALADAVAARRGPALLVDYAAPDRSGLIAATDAELGPLEGGWRFGRRGQGLLIVRRAARGTSAPCPPPGLPPDETLVVDLGHLEPADAAMVAASCVAMVLVGRAGVPGLQAVERHLSGLPLAPAHHVVAALTGSARWSRAARAAAGPGLRRLLAAELVVPVPVPTRLQERGLTPDPLPRPVNAAGKQLLEAALFR